MNVFDFENFMKGLQSLEEPSPLTRRQLENGIFNIQHILGELVQGKWMKLTGKLSQSALLLGMGEDGTVGFIWIGLKLQLETNEREQIIRIPNAMTFADLVQFVYTFNLVEIERMINEGEEIRRSKTEME